MKKDCSRKGAKALNIKNEFLEKLANLCEQFDASFSYTTDDDGIHIELSGQEIFVGYLDADLFAKYQGLSVAGKLRSVLPRNREP